ncbi:MAG: helix-turn-helix transcriptional regulator [Eubacteriales bacterium]|nr:helix-turn-helix transcriptional regulator [Eubacteriales bacterium]
MKDRQEIKTTFLLQELRESKSIYTYLQNNFEVFSDTVFSEYLSQIIIKNKISKSELVQQSGLSKSYAYALLSGDRRPPSRNRVLSLALAVRATLEETQNLLTYSEFTVLSPKTQRDAAIIFAIEQQLTALQLNDLLFDLGLEDLVG